MRVLRVVVPILAAQGAAGGLVTELPRSLTLGAGPQAGGVLGDNLSPRHQWQLHRIVRRHEPPGSDGERKERRAARRVT